MLNEYNKVTIPATSGSSVTLEVNFSDDPDSKDCVKINGKDVIKMEDLYRFLLVAGTQDMQVGLMPVQQKEVKHIERYHNVRVNRDIRKGEHLKVHCEFDVDVVTYEGIAGMVGGSRKTKPSSPILVPK